jgi:hypothetical protein
VLHYREGQDVFTTDINDGLLSGVKVTSIFGSLINYVICKTIMNQLNLEIEYISVLGDDIEISSKQGLPFDTILSCYEDIKFPIARSKTFYCEGLRIQSEFL